MEIKWTEEEIGEAGRRWAQSIRAVMDYAVSLFLARASGQVKEDLERVQKALADTTHFHRVTGPEFRTALSRLSTLAQDRERLRAIIAYIQECDAGPHLLTEAGALASDRKDEVREESESLRSKVAELERQVSGHEVSMDAVHEALSVPPEGHELDAIKALRAKVESQQRLANKLHGERDAARAEAAALTTRIHDLERARDALRVEVEGLKAEEVLSDDGRQRWKERALTAESQIERLKAPLPTPLYVAVAAWLGTNALVPEQVRHGMFPLGMVQRWMDRAESAESRLAAIRDRECIERALDDAPQETKANNSDAERQPTIAELEAILSAPENTYKVEVRPDGQVRAARRYPCSPTCTHDDATTPGHPERVRQQSEAVKEVLEPLPKLGIYSPGEVTAWGAGVEAMRAACWEAVQAELAIQGYSDNNPFRLSLKAAIEGAAP